MPSKRPIRRPTGHHFGAPVKMRLLLIDVIQPNNCCCNEDFLEFGGISFTIEVIIYILICRENHILKLKY
jgi:hypothetical protein